jgi:hypothetical protein
MRAAPIALAFLLAACGEGSEVNPPTEPAAPVQTPEATAPLEQGAGALPGTGPASFVGRWSAEPEWCAAPAGERRPIEITATRFEGYENSCAIAAVDQVAGGYDAVLDCTSEGRTNRERVGMAVTGDLLALTYLDRGGRSVRLVKCTTLGETPTGAPSLKVP